MATELKYSQYPSMRHLVDDVRCEKALIAAALTGAARAAIFVDNAQSPGIALLAYGDDAIICGAPMNIGSVGKFITEVQVHPSGGRFSSIACVTREWRDALLSVPGFRFAFSERSGYRFRGPRAPESRHSRELIARGFTTRKMDYDLAQEIFRSGEHDFHDFRAAWRSPDEFVASGLGYCSWKDPEIASIAFSYFPVTEFLEIGIATREKFRKQGLAGIVGLTIIEHCASHGIEPLWSCFSDNKASNELAKKLGFEYEHTYYWLYEKGRGLRELLGSNRWFGLLAALLANRPGVRG